MKTYVGVPGVDKTIDRRLAELVVSSLGEKAWLHVSPSSSERVWENHLNGIPAIVRRFAELGLLTPEEIDNSPTLNKDHAAEIAAAESVRREIAANQARARKAAADAAAAAERAAAEAVASADKAVSDLN